MPRKKGKTGHKRFSPSKSKRWLNCPGSVQLSEQVPPLPPSVYAAEGTAAHKLAELCLREQVPPDLYHGETIEGFVVDDEMVGAVEVYLNTVQSDIERLGSRGLEVMIECKVDADQIHPETGGTSDLILRKGKQKLVIYDYKHGKGVDVDAEENTQGLCYALEYSVSKNIQFKEYEFVIVQPRLDDEERHVKRWTFRQKRLNRFHMEVMRAIQGAGYEEPEFNTGDWCRFCPASGICPKLHNTALEKAQAEFQPVSESIDFTTPTDLTPQQLILVLNNIKLIESWLKSVETYAIGLLKQGETIPGFKLVNGRSRRVWKKSDKETEEELLKRGYPKEDITVEKIVSPAQLEKVYEPEGFEDLWEKPEGKLTIAPEDDPRPEAALPAITDFEQCND